MQKPLHDRRARLRRRGSARQERVRPRCIGEKDTFTPSGDPKALYPHYSLTQDAIITAVKRVMTRKK